MLKGHFIEYYKPKEKFSEKGKDGMICLQEFTEDSLSKQLPVNLTERKFCGFPQHGLFTFVSSYLAKGIPVAIYIYIFFAYWEELTFEILL